MKTGSSSQPPFLSLYPSTFPLAILLFYSSHPCPDSLQPLRLRQYITPTRLHGISTEDHNWYEVEFIKTWAINVITSAKITLRNTTYTESKMDQNSVPVAHLGNKFQKVTSVNSRPGRYPHFFYSLSQFWIHVMEGLLIECQEQS